MSINYRGNIGNFIDSRTNVREHGHFAKERTFDRELCVYNTETQFHVHMIVKHLFITQATANKYSPKTLNQFIL